MPIRVEAIGVPHKVLSHYGTPEQQDEAIGFTEQGIRQRIEEFLQRNGKGVGSVIRDEG
ncbi:MAG: hypothetical protein H0W02_11535 [Ktedonobacteraceae bacterium]|nr:hypothetical protein [Ktedonobacteraceae bacterium]